MQASPARTGFAPWWLWVLLVSGVLIAINGAKLYKGIPDAFDTAASAMNLFAEGNIAVWWSGFCLMAAGILFYRLASQPGNDTRDTFMWLVLAVVILGLSADDYRRMTAPGAEIGGGHR